MVWQQSHESRPWKKQPFFKLQDSEKKPGAALTESNSNKKLLEIKIDSDLIFDEQISSVCNKVGKKNVLCRLDNYISFDKHSMVMRVFIEF